MEEARGAMGIPPRGCEFGEVGHFVLGDGGGG